MTAKIAASILSADFAALAQQVKLIEAHADLIHIDCMDAHFVPVLTVGPVVIQALRPHTALPLHCHLQVEQPERLFADFANAGADIVTAHLEACPDPAATIADVEGNGMRAGLAVNPETDIRAVFPHLEHLDRVVVMSVHPGWAGQRFIEGSLPRIEAVRTEIDRLGLDVEVEVDGGIDERTGGRCVAAGATVLAAATSIFHAGDPAAATRRLAAAAQRGAKRETA